MRSDFPLRWPWLTGGWLVLPVLLFGAPHSCAQEQVVHGKVEVAKPPAKKQSAAAPSVVPAAEVVVWLSSLDDDPATPARTSAGTRQLIQRNKSFEPHVLAIEVGSVVQFPNKDPFFHNVFSLFDGKRFDLGLYEAGSSNSVRFDRPGISYLFCNIHPEMSAMVVAVPTPWFGVSDASGQWSISAVPDGRYRLHVWYERSSAEDLQKLQREILISGSARSLESIRVVESASPTSAHKNKYGKDYVPPASPAYTNP